MSLQRKLTLFFVTIVMLPLVAAAFIVQRVISDEVGERAVLTMRPTIDATMALYNDDLAQLEQRVRSSITEPGRLSAALESNDRAKLRKYLQERLMGTSNLDFLLIQRDRTILAYVANEPRFLSGVPVPNAYEVAAATKGAGKGFIRSRSVPLEVAGGGPIAQISGGMWVDRELLAAGWRSIVGLSVVADGDVIASTASVPSSVHIDIGRGPFEASLGGPVIAVSRPLEGEMSIVASTPSGPIDSASGRVLTAMLVLLLFALAVTTALAYVLARAITQPLDELAEGAMAISEGRFDHQIPVRSKDEVGQLAQAFNKMTAHLSQTISELSWSRDQLRKSIQRVGDTLRSTHDMKQLLESVLNTATDAVQAEAAVFWAFTPTREELHPSIAHGTEIDPLVRVAVGEGAVGLVAERATPVLIPNQTTGGPRFSRYEPRFPVAVAVPVYSQDKIRGVLALYRVDPRKHFTEQDVEMVTFLAEQGGTAIENVLLHEEAQRLSITDGLTGIWNRRYFQMQFRQVLATATRFDRTFSILLLDLDHFKKVNDTYGHRRGDEILVEFSQRVTTMVREVDTFARYGGEEFACLLTETEMSGALTTAEKIREAVRREPFGEGEGTQLHLTVSIGVATYPDHGDSFVSLIEAADKALYRAKQTGRDQVCVAERLRLAT